MCIQGAEAKSIFLMTFEGSARHALVESRGEPGLCCMNSVMSSSLLRGRSSGDREDVEQFVDKANLVLDVRLAGEAMTAPIMRIPSKPLIVADAVFIVWKPRVGRMTRLSAP